MSETLLVTGASGQLGRAVLHYLLDAEKVSPSRLVATTRDPSKLADLSARGVAVRRADFDDPSTLASAFAGADKVLVISTDTLDLTGGRRLRQQRAAVAAAKQAGASCIAYTSEANPEGSPFLLTPDHLGTEKAIRESGLRHTIYRPNTYQEMLLLSLPAVVATGKWYTAAGEGRVAYAARDDMAAAIAAHLATPWKEDQTLTLTGEEAYTNGDVAKLVTELTGRPVAIVDVDEAALVGIFVGAGIPEPFARTLASGDAHTRAGHAATTNDVVARLSRRRPRSLASFLAASKEVLVAAPR